MYATRQNISLKLRQTNAREKERMTRDWPEINWPRLAVKQGLQVGGRRLSITLLIIGGLHGSLPLVPSLHSLPQDKGKIFRGILTFSTKQCVALKKLAKVHGVKLTRYPLCTKFFYFRRLSLTSIKWVLQPNQVRRAERPRLWSGEGAPWRSAVSLGADASTTTKMFWAKRDAFRLFYSFLSKHLKKELFDSQTRYNLVHTSVLLGYD